MLNQSYYDAEVISDEIDANHAGAVRVKIIGVTDDLDIKDQPFVLPVVNSIMAVPTKGTMLRVEFENGDVNTGRYTHWSATTAALPKEYIDNYPNVAVSNLGSDLFIMIHNRAAKETVITHDSSSRVIWDSDGRISHDSDLAYGNAGLGAKGGTGSKIQPVLTGGTIDIFCCTPMGASQGSEYLHVSHVSKKTVEGPKPAVDISSDTAVMETGQTRPLLDGTVEYMDSPTKTISTSRDIKYVLVTCSGGSDFTSIATKLLDASKNLSYHYLIGSDASDKPADTGLLGAIGSSRNADTNSTPNGFVQFVELLNIASFGSDGLDDDDNPVNLKSISVCLVGEGTPLTTYSEYQYLRLKDILLNAQNEYGEHVKLITADTCGFTPSIELGFFDTSRF